MVLDYTSLIWKIQLGDIIILKSLHGRKEKEYTSQERNKY